MAYKPPRDLAESERLLKAHADAERVKGDWAFLGHSIIAFSAVVCLIVVLVSIVAGLF